MNLVLDNEYQQTLEALKERVRSAQLKAARAVNTELIQLYWDIGNTILDKQKNAKWGSKFLEQTSKDLISAFPGMKGFSSVNLKRMRMFANEFSTDEIGSQAVTQLPWGHIVELMFKVKSPEHRTWYAKKTIENGWSRKVLTFQIGQDLYARQGTETKKISNFAAALPAPQSELAYEVLKDPFKFEFLSIDDTAKERDIEEGLVNHIRDFLLELGSGFSFVGNQYHLNVGGDDFYIDCLFYQGYL